MVVLILAWSIFSKLAASPYRSWSLMMLLMANSFLPKTTRITMRMMFVSIENTLPIVQNALRDFPCQKSGFIFSTLSGLKYCSRFSEGYSPKGY
ncbi:MAG: hypothetical protein B5M51_08525 [Anaerolinea sp. 4484_236]|nr:MAG: hypothetical protein B5M51_08525 [Anaerolinea sp. 4484_236]